jgi:hypothetical protein
VNQHIKTTSFGKERVPVVISGNAIRFGDQFIALDNVDEMKYGVAPVEVDMFVVGRRFVLELKSKDRRVEMVLTSWFGVSRGYFLKVYSQILELIWDKTMIRIASNAIDSLIKGESVHFDKCTIDRRGVTVKTALIPWHDLTYQRLFNKLVINSRSRNDLWINLYYLESYNTEVAVSILEWVYQQDGLLVLKKS